MKLAFEPITLRTATPFVIARGGSSEYHRVWVRVIEQDGTEGWGEAAPNAYYGESAATVCDALPRIGHTLRDAATWSLDAREAAIATIPGHASARGAVSMALHDLDAKRAGLPLWRHWGLEPAHAPKSSFTIAITHDAAELRRRVDAAAEYPILKIKLGTERDAEIVRAVREAAPEKILRVDANAAWDVPRALAMLDVLVEHDIEFIEQPLPADDLDGLRAVRARSTLPIIADESCVTSADVPRLEGVVDGVNLKLSKCGGLLEARRIIDAARARGMLVMAGCMIESSLGITAAAHLAPLLDAADLDGAALLADDPFSGATIAEGVIRLPGRPGLGVMINREPRLQT